MRRSGTIRGVLLLAGICLAGAEIIDRIAVSVGNRVITTSDIEREIRVTAFLNGTKPDFGKASREATSDRMVEQTLIRIELETSHYRMPATSEVQPVFDKFKQDHYRTEDEFRAALAAYGITEQDIRNSLLWQRTVLLFINARFRPAVEVTGKEIEEYFRKEVAPIARASASRGPATIEEYRSMIEETLIGKRVDEQMNKWLEEARRRTRILLHPEAFK